ncbi:hypothetical protein OSTOST_08742 [Ostertagia ostertagi]
MAEWKRDANHDGLLHFEQLVFRFDPFIHRLSNQKFDCKKDHSLVAIRHFLVAQQILLSLSQYNERHRSHGAPPSLRVDFAALVLRYTNRALSIALEQSKTALW